MSLQGSGVGFGLLRQLHGENCQQESTYSSLAAVPNTVAREGDPDATPFYVVYMEWCDECGAADYEIV